MFLLIMGVALSCPFISLAKTSEHDGAFYEEELERAQADVAKIESEIAELGSRLTQLEKEVSDKQKETSSIKVELQASRDLLNTRLVELYKHRGLGILEMMVGIKDVGDLVFALLAFERLTKSDIDQLKRTLGLRSQLERHESELLELRLLLLSEKNRLQDALAQAQLKKERMQEIYYEKGGLLQKRGDVDATQGGWGESFADVGDWELRDGMSTSDGIAHVLGPRGKYLLERIVLRTPVSLASYPYLTLNIKAAKGNVYRVVPLAALGGGSIERLTGDNPLFRRHGTGRWEVATFNLYEVSRTGREFAGIELEFYGSEAPVDVELDWVRLHSGLAPDEPRARETNFSNQVDEDSDGKVDKDDPDYDPPKYVLAFYHNWYGSRYGPTGYWFHWNHNGYNPDRTQGGRRDVASAHYPLIPPERYDSMDPGVLAQHVQWAISAGIDGFVVDWWGVDHYEDRSFQLLLSVVERRFPSFKLGILYDGHYGRDHKAAVQIGAELRHVVTKYGHHPNYLKIGGKPVILIWKASAHTASEWVSAYEAVPDRREVLFLTDEPSYASFSDGYSTYTSNGIGPFLRVDPTLIVSETVMPGWDNRKVENPGVVISRANGSFYARSWANVFKNRPAFVLICSWNEWHEGSEIEPSVEYGDLYLGLTREFAKKYKGS